MLFKSSNYFSSWALELCWTIYVLLIMQTGEPSNSDTISILLFFCRDYEGMNFKGREHLYGFDLKDDSFYRSMFLIIYNLIKTNIPSLLGSKNA
jgi:hypothetical protein